MDTTIEPLEDNKVKLRVAIPSAEFEPAIDAASRKLAGQVRIPGFRPGKAPRRVLEAHLGGPGAAREQALRDAIPDFYQDAVLGESLDVIAPPEIEILAGQDEGDVEFEAVVELRPKVTISGYDALRVEVPFEAPDDAAVDRQVNSLRERFADLVDSEHPLISEDYATIDIAGSIDGEEIEGLVASDYLYQVGSGTVVPELDEQLAGTRPGAVLEFSSVLPETAGERAGQSIDFRVVVKEAKQKQLPELTDDWVREASEFDTLDELRADIRNRIDLMGRIQARMAVRDKVLEAVSGLVPIEPPEALVEDEVRARINDLAHRLSHQGATLDAWLEATGQEPQAFIDSTRADAKRAILADLALRSVVEQEAIGADDTEVDTEVERLAERFSWKKRDRRQFEQNGGREAVRSDLARNKAVTFLVDHATVVDAQGAEIDLSLPEGTEEPEPDDDLDIEFDETDDTEE